MRSLEVFALSAGVAVVATPLAGQLARRLGILDHPGPLKVQKAAVPYLGGLGVFAGIVAGGVLGRPRLLLPLALALALGTVDDAVDLPPMLRLACELGIGGAVAWTAGLRPGVLWAAAAVLLTVALINAVNLIDGLDALAAGVTVVAAGGLSLVAVSAGRLPAMALLGAGLGFLCWNRPPARIYLGDGGAYLLGTGLAVLVAATARPAVRVPHQAAAILIVALPGIELLYSILRRVRSRAALFEGDRSHGYDRLVQRGWSARAASAAYIGCEAVVVAASAGVARLTPWWSVVAATAMVVLVIAAAAVMGFGVVTPDQAR